MSNQITHNFGSIGEAAKIVSNYLKNFYAVNDRDARLVRRINQDLQRLLKECDDGYRELFEEHIENQRTAGITFTDEDIPY